MRLMILFFQKETDWIERTLVRKFYLLDLNV